nr:hypothetical protein [Marseillevirus cajuinensis]
MWLNFNHKNIRKTGLRGRGFSKEKIFWTGKFSKIQETLLSSKTMRVFEQAKSLPCTKYFITENI